VAGRVLGRPPGTMGHSGSRNITGPALGIRSAGIRGS